MKRYDDVINENIILVLDKLFVMLLVFRTSL